MSRKNILFLDVDSAVRDTLIELLQAEYECMSLQSGEDSLSFFENSAGNIDLIITDLETARQTEFVLLSWLDNHAKYKNIPLLAILAIEQPENISLAFEMGADDIIAKPLNPELVRKRVGNMLCVGGNRMIHNVMEDLLQAEIDEYIGDLGMCDCPICRRDLLSLTLNHMEPKYVTSERGAAITKAERIASRDSKLKLLTQIAYCAQIVKQKPNHN